MKCEARKSSQFSNDIKCSLTDYTNGDILDVNSSRSTGDCMFSVGRKFKFNPDYDSKFTIASVCLGGSCYSTHVRVLLRLRDLQCRTYHVYASGKRQKLNFCRLPSSPFCNNVEIFAFVVNSRHFSIFRSIDLRIRRKVSEIRGKFYCSRLP